MASAFGQKLVDLDLKCFQIMINPGSAGQLLRAIYTVLEQRSHRGLICCSR